MARKAAPKPKSRRRKDARPQEIIAAGLSEFARKGFAAAKLEDVARGAGVSKATIYVYYKDKQALFEACMKQQSAPLFDAAAELIDTFPGSMSDLLKLMLNMVHQKILTSDIRYLLRVVIAESDNFPFLGKLHYEQTLSRADALLQKIMQRGMARGEFQIGPCTRLPIVIMGPALLAAIWSMVFQPHHALDHAAVLDAHVDLVLNGIKARHAPQEQLK